MEKRERKDIEGEENREVYFSMIHKEEKLVRLNKQREIA